jgi:hypothetical protein
MMTGVKDYTESGKIKRVSYEEIKTVDPRKLAGCYGDLRKKWVSKSFWRYFNARNRRS